MSYILSLPCLHVDLIGSGTVTHWGLSSFKLLIQDWKFWIPPSIITYPPTCIPPVFLKTYTFLCHWGPSHLLKTKNATFSSTCLQFTWSHIANCHYYMPHHCILFFERFICEENYNRLLFCSLDALELFLFKIKFLGWSGNILHVEILKMNWWVLFSPNS